MPCIYDYIIFVSAFEICDDLKSSNKTDTHENDGLPSYKHGAGVHFDNDT